MIRHTGQSKTMNQVLRQIVDRPAQQLGRFGRAVKWVVDLVRHCAAELYYDRASEMAAALTYRTIFGLVPLLVLALVVFNAFGGFRSLAEEVQNKIYQYLGLSQLAITVPVKGKDLLERPADRQEEAHAVEAAQQVRARVDHLIRQLTENVGALSFRSIGIVGLILLIWAAISLISSVEDCFNRIYDCPVGRPWRLRVPIYWAVITLGPVLLFLGLYLTKLFVSWSSDVGGWMGWLGAQTTQFAALATSWLLLFLLYTLVPNTHVARHAAVIGSFVAAVLYELAKWLFGLYVARFMPYSLLYGTLALVPLFLFWVYLIWLVVLFGLELTYALQAMRSRRFKYLAQRQRGGEMVIGERRWIIPLMLSLARAFERGQAPSLEQLSRELDLPVPTVAELLRMVIEAGLVHPVEAEKVRGYALSLPAHRISLMQLLELARGPIRAGDNVALWQPLEKLAALERQALGTTTLADLLAEPAASGSQA